MTLKQAFIYVISVFTMICLVSYAATGQSRRISMQEALKLTLSNNRNLKITELDVERAQQQVIVAKSQYLPTAGVSAQIAHYFKVPAFFGFGAAGAAEKIPYGRFGGKDQAAAAVYVSQPLYNAGTKPGLQYAKLREQSDILNVSDKKAVTSAMLKQTYILILVLNERIKLQEESIQRNEKALQDARSLLAQGRALRVDTLRAYATLKNLEPDVLKLRYAIETGKQQLKNLVGLDSLKDIILTDSLRLPPPSVFLSEEEVYSEAKRHRADLQAIDLHQQLADQQTKIAAAPMKPTDSVNAQYLINTQVNNFNYGNGYFPSTPFVGALVTVPIFNGNSNRAKVQESKILKQQSVVQSKNAYEELRTEVKQVVADVRETNARIQTSSNVKETAVLSYDITQYRYAKGVASRLELSDAELALTTAQSNYLEAVYDYLSAVIALERTIGKTGE